MLSENKQWEIGIVLAIISLIIGIVAWQYPISAPNSPTASDFQDAAYTAVESHSKKERLEKIEEKYVRSFTLTSKSSEGWVDTGIVLKRDHKIYIRRHGENDGTSHSSNYWAVLTNIWDNDKGTYRSISDRWSEDSGSREIETNDILGSKQNDTLKIAAYWESQDEITLDIIVDYGKYMKEYPYPSE